MQAGSFLEVGRKDSESYHSCHSFAHLHKLLCAFCSCTSDFVVVVFAESWL